MFYCQKLVVVTWVTISSHTLVVDALRQMNPITGGFTPGNLSSYQIIDDGGTVYASQAPLSSTVYASQAPLSSTIQLLPYPVQSVISSVLSAIFP